MSSDIVQMGLFDNPDPRPLPLIVASNWGFSLTHVERTPMIFCAVEWYLGLGGDKGRWSKSKVDWLTGGQPVMIEVKRPHRKPEMLEFVTDETLYRIAARMEDRKDRPQLAEIKRYLASAGVFADAARREPEKVAQSLMQLHRRRELSKLQAAGYSDHEAVKLLETRITGIDNLNALKDIIKRTCTDEPQYGRIINQEYLGLFGYVAKELKGLLGTADIREKLPRTQYLYLQTAESSLRDILAATDRMTSEQISMLAFNVCKGLGNQLTAMCAMLGVHPVTGQKLLKPNNYAREDLP